MDIIQYFNPQPNFLDTPSCLRNPFDNDPHALAVHAADLLKQKLKTDYVNEHPFFDEEKGKMFGVMIVANDNGDIAYLSSFSGMLDSRWIVSGFVPPIFDTDKMALLLNKGERKLIALTDDIFQLTNNSQRLLLMTNLAFFKKTSHNELLALKHVHKVNKQLRDLKRVNLVGDTNADKMLHDLARQSQFEKKHYKKIKRDRTKEINALEKKLNDMFEVTLEALKQQRKILSRNLQQSVFNQYQLVNNAGVVTPLVELFDEKTPPSGAGDCAAPKLIHYALKQGLKILALTEFWWGASPKKEVRHHQHFYEPCRSKCHKILPFMFQGLELEDNLIKRSLFEPKIVYEDESIIVLNKPAGMLSIPGKEEGRSVLTWLKNKYPQATGGLLIHRLDQATSGLLLAAKNSHVYKSIQQQFINRTIKKRYVALLSKKFDDVIATINLPLRVDLDDRPRQLVCFEHGKQGLTTVKLIKHEGESSRVYFYPKTGRTHQLRVHAAHKLGLSNPIVGDVLYGKKAQRLMLHAEKIEFYHPFKQKNMSFQIDTPF